MAKRAISWEATRDVCGVGSPIKVGFVAGETISGRGIVVIVGMALRARNSGVLTRQRVMRVQRVIERGIRPVEC